MLHPAAHSPQQAVAQEGSLGASSLPGLIYQIPVSSLSYIKSYSIGEALSYNPIHNFNTHLLYLLYHLGILFILVEQR